MARNTRSLAVLLIWALTTTHAWSQSTPAVERPLNFPPLTDKSAAPAERSFTSAPLGRESKPIAAWIEQLDAPVFIQREAAMANLIQAGSEAVAPMSELLSVRNAEVANRALYVLRAIAQCGDELSEDLAFAALESAAESRGTLSSRRADLALHELAESRQDLSIAALTRLGARFRAPTTPFGVQIDDQIREVEFGAAWTGQEKDLRRLRWLTDITKITLSGEHVSDQTLKLIGELQLRNVTELRLKHAKISIDGIEFIKQLPNLQKLGLRYLPVTDAFVPQLASLKTLQKMEVYGTEITPEAAKKLRADLEFVELDYRRGGFLGIGGTENLLGFHINLIQKDSAAAKADVREDDVLIKFENDKIRSFAELTNRISKNWSGETVTLTLARDLYVRKLNVVHESKRPWGATTKPHDLGLEVTEVTRNSVASDNGLRVGDVIVTFKRERVNTSDELKERFDANEDNESYDVDYVRQPRLLKVPVTLGEWE